MEKTLAVINRLEQEGLIGRYAIGGVFRRRFLEENGQRLMQTYPDLSHIFSAKAQRRLALAALSWEEKVAIVEQMRVSLPKGSWKHRPEDEKSPTHKTPTQPRTLRNSAD